MTGDAIVLHTPGQIQRFRESAAFRVCNYQYVTGQAPLARSRRMGEWSARQAWHILFTETLGIPPSRSRKKRLEALRAAAKKRGFVLLHGVTAD